MRLSHSWLLLAWVCGSPAAAETAAPPRFGLWSDAAEVVDAEGPAIVRVPTAALILSGQSGGAIPLSVLATPVAAAHGAPWVSVLTEIGGSAFTGEEAEIGIEIFVYALDPAGNVAGSTAQSFRLDRARYGPRLASGLEVFTPLALAPGDYTLRVLVRHLQTRELGVGGWPLTVPALGAETTVLLPPGWSATAAGRLLILPSPDAEVEGAAKAPAVHRAGAADSRPRAADRASPRLRRRLQLPRQEIAAGYRQALRRLADGDEPAARERIADLEYRAAGTAPLALDDLAEVEWRILAEIAGERWQSVLPVVLLHARLIDDYQRRQAVHLTEHALRMSSRLAEELAERAASPAARAEAVQALAGLGGRFQRLQRLGESDALLERAVALDGGHAAVRLALAANDERRGRYPEVVEELEPLVERHPDHHQGRLRLALNLARVGRGEEARRLLAELRLTAAPDWIAELAFQEGARLALLEEPPDVALGLLEQALRRWPNHPTLSIQMASVLDRLDRPRAARQRLRGLGKPVPGPRHGSARVRYAEWPDELRQVEPLLAASSELRRADLARLLASSAVADAP
ncbi:MAG: hypothetical protein V3T72_03990 [Thermoanaerobaculia bacterium]